MTGPTPPPSWSHPEFTDCGINVGSDLGDRYEALTERYAEFYLNDKVLILLSRDGRGYQTFADGVHMALQSFKIQMRDIAKREFDARQNRETNADGVELRTISWVDYYPLVFDTREAGDLGL
jgi:hypothetical protein